MYYCHQLRKVKVCLYGNNGRDYYNYLVTIDDIENEVVDLYAKAVGVNDDRGMVVDLESTNPDGWSLQNRPILKKPTDAIIYEIHIRDFSIDENSGVSIDYKGKYRGMCEKATKLLNSNIRTGIDYLKELGINVLHLLQVFDYKSIDESKLEYHHYNLGYDPQNYNVPEGAYSSDPFNAKVRIREFKDMIRNFHNLGINMVMDVVYNHTTDTENSNFNYIVPGYYYRKNDHGTFSNASQCGNEIASERYMVRKFIVNSLCYWTKEYKIDGFRFDLMGIHDIETMKIIRRKLYEIDKSISNKAWANEPYQTITYTSSHDNYTLWDKLNISTQNETKENRVKMNKLAAAIILTSQGIPFIYVGYELLRIKKRIDGTLEENSYNSPR